MKNKKALIIIIVAVLTIISAITITLSGDFEEATTVVTESSTEKGLFENFFEDEEKTEKKVNIETTKQSASTVSTTKKKQTIENVNKVSSSSLPVYKNNPYVTVNNNNPVFTSTEKSEKKSFETYSALDYLGRCGVAFACIGKDIMPTGERGEIGQVKPSGWKTAKYDFVDGKYLYNRCHLIGWQLTGENANNKNLITGTRYMNVQGMLPFENMVDDYIEETGNHVLYRVTPIFKSSELVVRGVQIEAYSIEDEGDGICFNVYCFNVQPGVTIDYQTGSSTINEKEVTTKKAVTTKKTEATKVATTKPVTTVKPTTTKAPTTTKPSVPSSATDKVSYIANTNTLVFHTPNCRYSDDILPENRLETSETSVSLKEKGYSPCGACKPY